MVDHKLMPKHGEQFTVDENDGSPIAVELFAKQREASIMLLKIIDSGTVKNGIVTLPCRQCVLDNALQFEDMGRLLRELADVKIKKDSCGND